MGVWHSIQIELSGSLKEKKISYLPVNSSTNSKKEELTYHTMPHIKFCARPFNSHVLITNKKVGRWTQSWSQLATSFAFSQNISAAPYWLKFMLITAIKLHKVSKFMLHNQLDKAITADQLDKKNTAAVLAFTTILWHQWKQVTQDVQHVYALDRPRITTIIE